MVHNHPPIAACHNPHICDHKGWMCSGCQEICYLCQTLQHQEEGEVYCQRCRAYCVELTCDTLHVLIDGHLSEGEDEVGTRQCRFCGDIVCKSCYDKHSQECEELWLEEQDC